MIEELKNILYTGIMEEVKQYEKLKKQEEYLTKTLKEKKYSIDYIDYPEFFDKDEINLDYDSLNVQPIETRALTKSYSFFDKIFKRKEYKQQIVAKKDYEMKKQAYQKSRRKLEGEISKLQEELNKVKEKIKSIEDKKIIERYKEIQNAKNISELGVSLEEAKQLLESNKIPFVLDESDKDIIQNECEFTNISDFVLVHKTMYMPQNDAVQSSSKKGVTYQEKNILKDGTEFNFEYKNGRNTIHFALNGEVGSHMYGYWDTTKYAIIIPFSSQIDKNTTRFNLQDTFIDGKVQTNTGIILCPESEIEQVQNVNPNTTVIGYRGKNVMGFADSLVSMMGYKFERVGDHSWQDEKDVRKVWNNMPFSGFRWGRHAESQENRRDLAIESYNRFLAIIEKVIQGGYSQENLEEIVGILDEDMYSLCFLNGDVDLAMAISKKQMGSEYVSSEENSHEYAEKNMNFILDCLNRKYGIRENQRLNKAINILFGICKPDDEIKKMLKEEEKKEGIFWSIKDKDEALKKILLTSIMEEIAENGKIKEENDFSDVEPIEL